MSIFFSLASNYEALQKKMMMGKRILFASRIKEIYFSPRVRSKKKRVMEVWNGFKSGRMEKTYILEI